MRFVIQRVKHASVTVAGEVVGKIDRGYMVLIGACDADDETILNLTKSDKKADQNGIKFVLLKKVGKAYIDKIMDRN